MTGRDTRTLAPDAQEALRFRVVAALREGMAKASAARTFGVSRTSIDVWLTRVAMGNIIRWDPGNAADRPRRA